uniref:Uncharacterized protein n=1 Tax=Rhizophora mucronata TaxID=61149 RepID=A0A2P2QJ16_RHIMU
MTNLFCRVNKEFECAKAYIITLLHRLARFEFTKVRLEN